MTNGADTIYALATAPGRAGVAVMRVSGPRAFEMAGLLRPARLPPARMAQRRAVVDPQTGQTVDHALILAFPAPGSFTGEDVLEFHLHGGPAIIRRVSDLLREEGF